MPSSSRDFLFEGACKAVAHGARLAMDAIVLLAAGRYSSAYVLSVMAREELGRANFLWKKGSDLGPEVALGSVELKAFKSQLLDHVFKLKWGQSITNFTVPPALMEKIERAHACNDQVALRECSEETRKIARTVRKGDPTKTHDRRMRAQYVSLDDGATPEWTNPADIQFEETRNLLLNVASEIGGTLRDAEADATMTEACARAGVRLPPFHEFDREVTSRALLVQPNSGNMNSENPEIQRT